MPVGWRGRRTVALERRARFLHLLHVHNLQRPCDRVGPHLLPLGPGVRIIVPVRVEDGPAVPVLVEDGP